MESERRQPPLDVELSRPVSRACRTDPELARAINAILLRAARRLRTMMEADGSVLVAGSAENIILNLRLSPPDGCRVEALSEQMTDSTPDLTV